MNEIPPELLEGSLSRDHVADAAGIHTEAHSVAHAAMSGTDASSLGNAHPRHKRKRTNWMLVTLFACLCVAYLFYVVVLPEIELSLFRFRNPLKKFMPPEMEMKLANRTLLRTCEFLFIGWFFYFGASIGSFLNVVAWRVPEGRTIVFGGSKCPFCNSHLRFIDNTPILGWLYLQGKCRTCRLPIAPRYLLIEIAVGTAFMWLALWELVRGGANLPHWKPLGRTGLVNIVLDPQWPLIGVYVIHAFLFGILIMLATANEGRKPFPIFPLVLIGFGLASAKIVFPLLDLVAWHLPFSEHGLSSFGPFADPALSVIIGGLAGATLGWISALAFARDFGAIVGRHWTLQCFLVGTVLGWQSVATIVVLSLIVYGIVRPAYRLIQPQTSNRPLADQAIGLNACFIITALVHHSFWFQIAHLMGLS